MTRLKDRVFEANIELVRRGLVIYTWGNVSAIDRERNMVIIKPRGIEYDGMTANHMVTVDLEGKVVEGEYLPSVDLDIHLEIYKHFPTVKGIAHTHSTWATAWAQGRRSIPVFGTTHADHFYGAIPCTRMLEDAEMGEDYEKNTGKVIVEALNGMDPMNIFAVLAAGHGPFTWGDSPEQAVEHSVILEETAKMAAHTLAISPQTGEIPQTLLDRHFLRKHGATAYFYQDQGNKNK